MSQQFSWRNRTLTCKSCGIRFLDSAAEQRTRGGAGQTAAPARCPGCIALAQLDRARRGVVTWYDPRRGYGFIRDDNGQKVFVHASALATSRQRLQRGQTVSYHLVESERGPSAVQVRVTT